MGDGAIACAVICGTPILIWLIVMIVLICQTHMPTCSIQDLYVPALNTKLPTFNSTTATATFVFFDLEFKNTMEEVGVQYKDGVNLALYYQDGQKSSKYISIANYTIPGFYQGHGKTAHWREEVETSGMPWLDAFAAVSNGSTVVFRAELTMRVQLKRWFWCKSKEKELMLGGNVEVNGSGAKVQKKGVKLVKVKREKTKDVEIHQVVGDQNKDVKLVKAKREKIKDVEIHQVVDSDITSVN